MGSKAKSPRKGVPVFIGSSRGRVSRDVGGNDHPQPLLLDELKGGIP